MNKYLLLEDRIHGDSMFPFISYMVDYLDGQVIFNMHLHPELEFIYIEEGSINLQIGTNEIRLDEGDGCFLPSEHLHGASPVGDVPFKLHAVVFRIDLLRSFGYDLIENNYVKLLNRIYQPIYISRHEDVEMLEILRNVIRTYEGKDAGFELKIKGYLFLLFAELLNKQEVNVHDTITEKDMTKTELLKQVLYYIDENYKHKLTVLDLASVVQMSEGHFSRFFKSYMRMTPMEYINTIRINKACALLKTTDRKLLDIVMDVGFQNQSYFIRLFKKQKGCTPKEWKRG
ncbi:helix-turn-helix transcriptional regulator [Metabacillus malikii]|uniref:AraC-like DNA-binding protein n=1 Tax=Metabacillus malikii TaxID=1504265 RepID=A0ABT9ZGI1_9BACI|nr:AraC family transcriptional regulator [Metabacillus malikii]MDQ0231377.1 AraC-like DNA-binding protein [Metabacillus malikii]